MAIALVRVLRMCGAIVEEKHLSHFNWTYQECMNRDHGWCPECMGPLGEEMRKAWERIYARM